MVCTIAVVGTSPSAVIDNDVQQLEQLKVKEDMLVERAKRLLDKEEALMSLERQLIAKQEALYWRERCLRSEQLVTSSTTTTVTDALSMPPLIQIQPRIMGLERRRVKLMYQPDRQLQLQQMHAGKLIKQSQSDGVAKHVQGMLIRPTQVDSWHTLDQFTFC